MLNTHCCGIVFYTVWRGGLNSGTPMSGDFQPRDCGHMIFIVLLLSRCERIHMVTKTAVSEAGRLRLHQNLYHRLDFPLIFH